jgi:hypothetical protein
MTLGLLRCVDVLCLNRERELTLRIEPVMEHGSAALIMTTVYGVADGSNMFHFEELVQLNHVVCNGVSS